MAVISEHISVKTQGNRDVIDLTPQVRQIIASSRVNTGTVTVFVPGSTAGITTIEYEPGLKKDIDLFFKKLAPYGAHYHHHDTWHDDNGSAHLQASLLGPGLTVPFIQGELTLGTWQQIVLIDCDTRSRSRKVVVQIVY